MAYKKFLIPFALSGTKTTVPDTNPGDGSVNYTDGYGANYSLDPATNPAALNIERAKLNELIYELSNAILSWEIHTTADFITSAENGGSAYSYGAGDRVRYDDGSGFKIYESLVNSNAQLPTGGNWMIASGPITAGQGRIANGGVVLGNIANIAANTLMANFTGSAAAPVAYSPASNTLIARTSTALTALPVPASTVVGRDATGDIIPLTLGTNMSIVAGALTASSGLPAASTAQTKAGTSTVNAITPAALKGAIGFSQVITTTFAMPATSTATPYSHGLGATPVLVRAVLICKSAIIGYAVGDEIDIFNTADEYVNIGSYIVSNATQVIIVTGSAGTTPFQISPRTGGAAVYAAAANFDVKLYIFG